MVVTQDDAFMDFASFSLAFFPTISVGGVVGDI
jgi:hypothetical protein